MLRAFGDWRRDKALKRYPTATRVVGHRDIRPTGGTDCPGPVTEALIKAGRLTTAAPAPQEDIVASLDDLKAALRDPDYLREVARFVVTGFPFPGADGQPRVLAGHLTVTEQLARIAIKAASDDLTPEQVKAAVAEALDAKYDATLTLSPKAGA
jgi:hypothetical protein